MMRIVRTLGIAFGLLLMAGGLWLLVVGGAAPASVLIFEGAVVVIGVVFERTTYKTLELKAPGLGWTRTAERFIDDASGKPVTVYIQTATGERKYVNE